MSDNLIISMVAVFILSILISNFVEQYEHNLKVASTNAGKNLVDSNCIDGETK